MPSLTDEKEDRNEVTNEDESEEEEEEDKPKLTLKFRNYTPKNAELKEYLLPPARIPTKTVNEEIEKKLNSVIEVNKTRDILNLAPRKANWDLKRDLASKLEALDIKTQKAIVSMVQQKIENQ